MHPASGTFTCLLRRGGDGLTCWQGSSVFVCLLPVRFDKWHSRCKFSTTCKFRGPDSLIIQTGEKRNIKLADSKTDIFLYNLFFVVVFNKIIGVGKKTPLSKHIF